MAKGQGTDGKRKDSLLSVRSSGEFGYTTGERDRPAPKTSIAVTETADHF